MYRLAEDVLPAQASSVPSERVFSSGKETDTLRRNSVRLRRRCPLGFVVLARRVQNLANTSLRGAGSARQVVRERLGIDLWADEAELKCAQGRMGVQNVLERGLGEKLATSGTDNVDNERSALRDVREGDLERGGDGQREDHSFLRESRNTNFGVQVAESELCGAGDGPAVILWEVLLEVVVPAGERREREVVLPLD